MLDSVIINQFCAFVAACDEGGFSPAARRLGRAQSAISHAVAALESALCVELFERNARKANLSPAGRSLLPDARAVIACTEEMKNRADAIARAGVPQISLAVDAYFPHAHLIDCLKTLASEAPMAEVNLRMTTMQGGEHLVLDGTCSLAVSVAEVPEASPSALGRTRLCGLPYRSPDGRAKSHKPA